MLPFSSHWVGMDARGYVHDTCFRMAEGPGFRHGDPMPKKKICLVVFIISLVAVVEEVFFFFLIITSYAGQPVRTSLEKKKKLICG